MRKIVILLLFLLIVSVKAGADKIVRITLKNGNVLEWGNCTERGNQLCTYKKAVGLFCINKSDVAFISGGEAIKQEKEDIFTREAATPLSSKNSKIELKRKTEEDKQDKKEEYIKVQEASGLELFEKSISEWDAKAAEQRTRVEESNRKAEESMKEFMDSLKKPIEY